MESYVDSREPEELRQALLQAGFLQKQLEYGDIQFSTSSDETVLIERKTIKQLLQDMDGQLQKQCLGMARNSLYPILMIEGQWIRTNRGTLLDTEMTWNQIWNQLQTLQDLGMRIQPTTGIQHSIQRILQLRTYYAKDSHTSVHRKVAESSGITVLSCIKGVDVARAKSLMEHFGNFQRLANANLEELQEVNGIGPVMAERIYNFWIEDQ